MNNSISKELLKEAAEHVQYEIEMFTCGGGDVTEATESTTGLFSEVSTYDKIVFLENFLLHFRVLYEFFYKRRNYRDDIRAKDFITDELKFKTFEENRTPGQDFEKYSIKVDKQLAHLTYKRIEYIKKEEHFWETGEIYKKMEKTINAFISALPDNRKEWFSEIRQITKKVKSR